MENQTNNNSAPAGETPQIANPLLKRAFMFLEDGNWESADEYCEKVLDQNPEDAYAYLGKLMAELKVGRKETLADCEQPFSDSSNYRKVLRFGSKALIQEVEEYHKSAIERLHKEFAQLREKIAPYQNALQGMICCGRNHFVGLRADGRVVAAGDDLGDQDFNVQDWRDIIGITAVGDDTFALRSNGTVTKELHEDENENNWYGIFEEHRQEIKRWKNIVAISGGGNGFTGCGHIVGLRADGTVVAAGNNNDGQCNVEAWHDIVAIAAGTNHTVGLRSNGTVVSTKYSRKDDIFARDQVQDWRNIIAIAAGKHTVGLRSDGTVAITGGDGDRPFDRNQIREWRDIVAIAAGEFHVIGLRSDGTAVAPEVNRYYGSKCDVEDWRNVVAITAYGKNSAALCANGSVIVGDILYEGDVQKWDLFGSGGIDGCIEHFKARKARAEKAEAERKAAIERAEAERKVAIERAEAERKAATERAEAERKAAEEKARAAAEKHRQEKIAALEAERTDLQARVLAVQDELANLKGLFTGRRRKELEEKTAEIMSRLHEISKELKTLGAKR